MRAQRVRIALIASAIVALALPAFAKRDLQKVTISGPGLAKPVVITDENILHLSSPWEGRFAIWSAQPVEGPGAHGRIYEVTLYTPHSVPPIYQFYYAPGQLGQPSVIYLPGSGEPWYARNARVIHRGNQAGRWHAVAPEWEAQVKRALDRSLATQGVR